MSELSLHEKLIDIQQRLKVAKDNTNEFGGFNYRNLEDIEREVKPLLAEHALTLTFYDEPVEVGGRVYIKAVAELSDGKDKIAVQAFAREAIQPKAKTDDAQLTGACSSYARKYAAGGLFLIDNTKDADSMDNSAPAKAQEPKKEWTPSKTKEATDKQREFIGNLLRQRGVEGKEAIGGWLMEEYGIIPNQPVTQADAQMIIDDLTKKEPVYAN